MEAVKAVLSGFIGIRRRTDAERTPLNPVHVIIVAVVCVVLFILTLVTVVHVVTR
jgi:Protein of unknown function (DUF2970)